MRALVCGTPLILQPTLRHLKMTLPIYVVDVSVQGLWRHFQASLNQGELLTGTDVTGHAMDHASNPPLCLWYALSVCEATGGLSPYPPTT